MNATVSRVDHEKEEATVVLLDAAYQLPVISGMIRCCALGLQMQ